MPAVPAFSFGRSDRGHLRIGEDNRRPQAIVDPFFGHFRHRIVTTDLTLQHGDMYDFERTHAVPGGEDVIRAGLHEIAGDDSSVLDVNASAIQRQAGEVRHASQCIEDDRGRGCTRLPAVKEVCGGTVTSSGDTLERGAREYLHAFFSESGLHRADHVRIAGADQLAVSLYQRGPGPHPAQELAKFGCDGAPSQHDDGFGKFPKFQDVVACEAAGVVQPGNGDLADYGTHGNDETPSVDPRRANANGVRRFEPRPSLNQCEFRAVELRNPVFCEFVHQPAFSVVDGGQVRRDFVGVQPEFSGPFHQRKKIRTAEQRLGGHAAAQDAEAAKRTLVDNGDARAAVRSDASGGVARAAPTYNDDVVDHVMALQVKSSVLRPVPVSESTNGAIARQEKNGSDVSTARTALLSRRPSMCFHFFGAAHPVRPAAVGGCRSRPGPGAMRFP